MNINRLKIRLHRFYRRLAFALPGKARPDFLIIGAQKAGTTALYDYLNQHPDIHGSSIKEVHFFNDENNFAKGYTWYEKHFKRLIPLHKKLFFEATPEYMLSERFMERIKNYHKDIKCVVILRDPVTRAYSSWNFFRKMKRYRDSIPDFKTCIENEFDVIREVREEDLASSLRFVRRGNYYDQLIKCLTIFPRDQFMIVGTKEFERDPAKCMNNILIFLGLRTSDWRFLRTKRRNVGIYRETMDEETRKRLTQYFEPLNEKLEGLIGFKPDW